MVKTSRKKAAKATKKKSVSKKKSDHKTYDKPLSLHPMSFSQALDKLLTAKPVKRAQKKSSK